MHKIITISREFGSGGRELGKRLAEELGIPCYDHQIIEMIAKENGFDERYVANVSEKSIEAAYPMTIGHRFAMPSMEIMEQPIRVAAAQRQIIENFAKQGDCVIIGRCADYALAENPNLLSLFISAPMEDRIARVAKRQKVSPEEAKSLIQKTDKRRAAYCEYYASKKWGAVDGYDFCLNSSALGLSGTVELIRVMVDHKENPIPSPTEVDPTQA